MSVPTATQAWQQRELGLARVAISTGPDWIEAALDYVARFARSSTTPFLTEQAREYAEAGGLPPPREPRAWGAVMQRAQRRKIIRAFAYAPTKSSNGSPKVLWKAIA